MVIEAVMSHDSGETTIETSFAVNIISEETETMKRCENDEITTTFTFDPISYEIGLTGELKIAPTWDANTIADCPSEYIFLRQREEDSGFERLP